MNKRRVEMTNSTFDYNSGFQDPSGVFPKPTHKSPAFPVARFTRLGFPVDAGGGGV